jgi:hypothetical protein
MLSSALRKLLEGEEFAFVLSQVWPSLVGETTVCIKCGQLDRRRHYTRGLCDPCYDFVRRGGGDLEDYPVTYTGRKIDGIRLGKRIGVHSEVLYRWRSGQNIPARYILRRVVDNLEAEFGVPAEIWWAAREISRANRPIRKARSVSTKCVRGHTVLDLGQCLECRSITAKERRDPGRDHEYYLRRMSPDFVPDPRFATNKAELDEDWLLALANEGWTLRALADEFHIANSAVYMHLKRLGFENPRAKRSL